MAISYGKYKQFGDDHLDDIIRWVGANTDPEDVFTTEELRRWAEDNGYMEAQESIRG